MKKKLVFMLACMPLVAMAGCSYDVVIDTDRDGTPDELDKCPTDPGLQADTGVCGCNLRLVNGKCVFMGLEDADADGVPDENDACPGDPEKITPGICGCGKSDVDSDKDGTPDCIDECPQNKAKIEEGYCGCDVAETDSDNDGVPDCVDKCPDDHEKVFEGACGCGVLDSVDADNDGTPDCVDQCPNDVDKVLPGTCGCGKPDNDSDNDGTPDCIDKCPSNPAKIAEGECGCLMDDADTDGDGVFDCKDGCPMDKTKTEPGMCGCNSPDVDTNQNGIFDCAEKCITSPIGKETFGYCGCLMEETDSDGDTVPDCVDLCPDDSLKAAPGKCGCNELETDTDGDSVADCIDTCPFDKTKSVDTGLCGCNPTMTYDEQFDDTFDSDGDGVPDCIDDCPFDRTRQELHACECSSSSLDRKMGEEWVCIGKGGVVQADYSLYHKFDTLQHNTHSDIAEAFAKRRIVSKNVRLAYSPGGNLLYNPALEYDSDGWIVSNAYDIAYNRCRFEERGVSRPFGKFPAFSTSYYETQFSQSVTLPEFNTSATLTAGLFAMSQSYRYVSGHTMDHGPDSIKISLTSNCSEGSTYSVDKEQFDLYTRSTQLDTSYSKKNVTVCFSGSDTGGWIGQYGAHLHYFALWLGDREIRFSNDGEHWTEWMPFTPNSSGRSDAWFIENWDLTDETYGGNSTPGKKTVYMQTHDLLLNKYYQATNTFDYYTPKEGGKIFIGPSPLKSQTLTSKSEVLETCSARTLTSTTADIAFIPAGNLLKNATFDDAENEATSADSWTMKDATILWRAETQEESDRHMPTTPVVALSAAKSSITQDIDVSSIQSRYFVALSFSSSTANTPVKVSITPLKDGEISGDIMSQTDSIAPDTHRFQIIGGLPTSMDTVRYTIQVPDDAESGTTRLDSLFFSLGKTFVRFSFDSKETWTNWLNIAMEDDFRASDKPALQAINNGLVYPNANLIVSEGKTTVCMQTYNVGMDEFYETCETVNVNQD